MMHVRRKLTLSADRRFSRQNAATYTNGSFDELHRSILIGWPRSAMGRSCYSGVTLFCIIKGDLRLECPH